MLEAAIRGVLCKKLFLEISQNSQENACARVTFLETLAQVFSCEFCEISKNTFFYRTPLDNCFRNVFIQTFIQMFLMKTFVILYL